MPPNHKTRPSRRILVALVAAVAVMLAATGCGATSGSDDPSKRSLRMMIPNAAGGGYDLTGRAAVKVMEDEDLTGRWEVSNVEGASGTVAMQRLLNEEGAEDLVMTMGLGVVGAVYTSKSEATPTKATPIARLIEEQEAIVVPADSPFTTLEDFVTAWEEDPGSITVGGGSAPGGPDHLFPMQLADTIGVEPTDVNYVEYDGGGPLTTALLGEKIEVGMTGLGEFEGQIEDGTLRVLAVSGEERLEGVDAPTLTESDIDLVFLNWRGVLAPPGISEEHRSYLIDLFTDLHDTEEWQQTLEDNGWTDSFATGEEFEQFLTEQDTRVSDTLKALGLA